jgi:acyl carrier protein
MTQQQIFDKTRNILVESFEVEPESVKPETRLAEDLALDSIDVMELVTQLHEASGRRFGPEDFMQMRTVSDVAKAISQLAEA